MNKWQKIAAVCGIYVFGVVSGFLLLDHQWSKESVKDFLSGPYTAFELIEEINEYRKNKGLATLAVDEMLCNGISDRWESANEDRNHKGFNSFLNAQVAAGRWPRELDVSELLVFDVFTAKSAVRLLSESPSHETNMSRPNARGICVYTNENTSIIYIR